MNYNDNAPQPEPSHETKNTLKSTDQSIQCNGRRDFLVRAGAVAGTLVLGLASNGCAQAQDAQAQAKPDAPVGNAPKAPDAGAQTSTGVGADEVVLKLDEASPLTKVGGSQTIKTAEGPVIVAHTGENTFAACSAICPHKGGPIKYDDKAGEFFCPWHGSRFDKSGKVLRPPARQPLKSYTSQNAVAVNLKK